MSLVPVANEAEIAEAIGVLKNRLKKDTKSFHRRIGWQGGNHAFDVYWSERERYWSAPAFLEEDRHIQFFGLDDPAPPRMLKIVCEANPAKLGVNLRTGGLIVRDDNGTVFLAHSGRVGGGGKGVGKSTFLKFYRGEMETVTFPWGEADYIVIGPIDSDRIQARLGEFVREVGRYKLAVSKGEIQQSAHAERGLRDFRPEFFGAKKKYQHNGYIEARCDHGRIVNALAEELKERGLTIRSDVNRDLVLLPGKSAPHVLFEVKPAATTSDIYSAIGQLLYHSARDTPTPRKVMVLPEAPNQSARSIFDILRIEVLVFEWRDGTPVFPELDGLLAR